MQRNYGPVREDYLRIVKEQGLVYVDTTVPDADRPNMTKLTSYWREGPYIQLENPETELIGAAGATLFQALIKATDKVLEFERAWHGDPTHRDSDCYFRKMAIPEMAIGPIMRSWQLDRPDGSPNITPEHWPSIYGRYDLCLERDAFGIVKNVKLLEYNADTPTSVVETAEIQWKWLEHNREAFTAQYGYIDQWNTLYDSLVERWEYELTEYIRKTGKTLDVIHVACSEAEEEGEDAMTIMVIGSALEEAARKMGTDASPAFRVKYIAMESINRVLPSGDTTTIVATGPQQGIIVGHFADGDPAYGPDGEKIKLIFKLHPWEYFLNEEHTRHGFGQTAMHDLMGTDPTIWIEPPYKMLWSNKGILAVLWDEFKDDPAIARYLLETYFHGDPNMPVGFMDNCALKPIYGREGANVTLYKDGNILAHGDGIYGREGYVVQALTQLPAFVDRNDGLMHVVAGLWMVGDRTAGICFREGSLVTNNTSFFIPHIVRIGASS